jgi:hypothetical protein
MPSLLHGEPARRITSNNTQSPEASPVSQCQDIFLPTAIDGHRSSWSSNIFTEPTFLRL